MSAGLYTMNIDENATWQRVFTWIDSSNNPIPMPSYTAELQIRSSKGENFPLILTLDNGSNGGIVLGATDGTITVTMTPTQTELIPNNSYYDLKLVNTASGGFTYRLLEGNVYVDEATAV